MEELVTAIETLGVSEKKMELEAIDEVAWRRIIQFLDPKSRLQCRLLSNTIETYVNYMGLQLRIPDMQRLAKHEKKAWRAFLATEDINFGKVHVTAQGANIRSLGLQKRHNVRELKISASLRLNSLLKSEWAQNLATLSLHTEALKNRRLFLGIEQECTILLPCLTKLYLNVTLKDYESCDDTLQNIGELLSKIRSDFMQVIGVEIFDFEGYVQDEPHFEIQLDLAAFLQSNAKSLQTVMFSFLDSVNFCFFDDDPETPPNPEFKSIPTRLKHLNIDFIKFYLPDSPWLKLLMEQKHLEELVDTGIEHYTEEGVMLELPLENYMVIMGQLCRRHFQTLKYIELCLKIDAMDLGIFGCCVNLEHLILCRVDDQSMEVYSNLSMLPTSLKVLKFGYDDGHPFELMHETSQSRLTYEDILHISKMKNLVGLTFCICLHLSASGFVQVVKAAMGLPKLNFLNMHYVLIQEEGFTNICQEFFPNLCEMECKVVLEKPCTPLTLSFAGKVVEAEPESEFKGTGGAEFETLCYGQFFEPASQCQKAQEFMDEYGTPPSKLHKLPKISETKFQLSRTERLN